MAKALASGFPLSAIIGKRAIMCQWPAGAHGSTYGGNPVSCAAALATIDAIEQEGMLENATSMGEWIRAGLREFQSTCPAIREVRGLGLMIGVELMPPSATPGSVGHLIEDVRQRCRENGLILLSCGTYEQVIRIMPALNINRFDADKGLRILTEAIQSARTAATGNSEAAIV